MLTLGCPSFILPYMPPRIVSFNRDSLSLYDFEAAHRMFERKRANRGVEFTSRSYPIYRKKKTRNDSPYDESFSMNSTCSILNRAPRRIVPMATQLLKRAQVGCGY